MKTYPSIRGVDSRTGAVKGYPPSETSLFPSFAQAEADEARVRQASERQRYIAQHRETMRACWPEWTGPAADGNGTSRFCEVHACCVHNLTHGDSRYHYMAPCRIESVNPDGLTVIAIVEYTRPGWARDRYNGECLRLDITEVWPPVWLLAARRREQEAPQRVIHAPAAA